MKHLEGLEAYAQDLEDFIDALVLPESWFAEPDHITVKCADAADFDQTLEAFKGDAEQISYVEMGGRRLATVKLLSSISMASLGEVQLVEVMEPRPEKIGRDIVGFEHMEFYYPDFKEVREVLRSRKHPFEMQGNAGHQWVNIVINNRGQEVKLNNRTLADTVAHEATIGVLSKIVL